MHNQIIDSLEIMNDFNAMPEKYNNIIVCGMGGSAIGGDFVKTVLKSGLKIPIFVNRDYDLPVWISKNTLVIICSYSGNTEETISCYNSAVINTIKPIGRCLIWTNTYI